MQRLPHQEGVSKKTKYTELPENQKNPQEIQFQQLPPSNTEDHEDKKVPLTSTDYHKVPVKVLIP